MNGIRECEVLGWVNVVSSRMSGRLAAIQVEVLLWTCDWWSTLGDMV